MINFRQILFVNGILLLIIAALMSFPLVYALVNQESVFTVFISTQLITIVLGTIMIFAYWDKNVFPLRIRETFLLTITSWVSLSLFAALPFMWGGCELSIVDAGFEAVSGLTTTGATVMRDLGHLPGAILLWRALLQWFGGAFVIASAMFLLPALQIGGMQFFHTKSVSSALFSQADRKFGFLPVITIRALSLYVILTVLLTIALMITGMTMLEAICHAMSCLSTGGFSTSNHSLVDFSHATQWVCVIGMLLGGMTFTSILRHDKWRDWKKWPRTLYNDAQIRLFMRIAIVLSLAMTFWNWASVDMSPGEAIRLACFNVVSILTSTGLHNGDYSSWGSFAQIVFFFLALVGGCTGSAAGGIKIFRHEVMFAASIKNVRQRIHPNGTFPLSFNGLTLTPVLVRSVMGFVILYFICFAGLSLILAITGLDLLSAISGSAAAIGNVGPALGAVIGPAGTFADLPSITKIILACGMLLGRLELTPMLLILNLFFWRE